MTVQTNDRSVISDQTREQIIELGSELTKGRNGNIYTLTVIGQIEGHQMLPENAKTTKYEHVLPLLASLEESEEIDGLLLLLNTVGGDIEAGLAIAELVASMRKPTVSLVLGGGHSIGVPLAVSAKESFIVPTASMTIHPVRMTGMVVGAPQTIRYFNRIQEQIVDFVSENSNISRKAFENYMMSTGDMATDVGTILYGREAVTSGLIDHLGGLNACTEWFVRKGREDVKKQPVNRSAVEQHRKRQETRKKSVFPGEICIYICLRQTARFEIVLVLCYDDRVKCICHRFRSQTPRFR